MQDDEKAIIDYLKSWPKAFVSGKEIARKVASRERFEKDHGWAIPILAQMVRLGTVETDHLGYFKLKVKEKKERIKKHVSPQMLNILKSSGKSFEGLVMDDEDADQPPAIPVYRKPSVPADKQPQ